MFFALACTLVSSVALSSAALASEVVNSPQWNFNASTTIASEYFGSIVGGTFYKADKRNHGVAFNVVGASRPVKDGVLYASALVIQPLDDAHLNKSSGNEWALTLGRTFEFDNNAEGRPLVKLDTFVMWDALQPIEKANDVITFSARIDLPRVLHAQPYVQIWHWERASGSSPEGGAFAAAGLVRRQPIAWPTADGRSVPAIDLEYRFGYSGGVFNTKAGQAYHRFIVSRTYKVGLESKWSVTPAVIAQTHVGHDTSGTLGKGSRVFATLTLGWRG